MADIEIRTAQNTVLLQSKASLGERMMASFLDIIVIASYLIFGAFILSLSSNGVGFWLLYMLPAYFYTLAMELFFHGQTFGKKIMKLKVVHCEGRNVPFSSYLLRWLLRIVDIWMLFGSIGTLSIILTAKGQRIGDIAANTIVISLKDNPGFYDLFAGRTKGADERVHFNQAGLLDDRDIEVVREVIAFVREQGYHGKTAAMILQTANSLKKKLSIETSMSPLQFLEQLLNDYLTLFERKTEK